MVVAPWDTEEPTEFEMEPQLVFLIHKSIKLSIIIYLMHTAECPSVTIAGTGYSAFRCRAKEKQSRHNNM